MIPKTSIVSFQEEILSWYTENQRELPWRNVSSRSSEKRDPYKILVSEVMSQQTQLLRVIPKYLTWIEKLPTIEELAKVDQRTVLQLWSGLGYNRRGLNLQKAAQKIVFDKRGTWPTTVEELEELPGVGSYTASALACFAFDKQIPVIDTNVRKVILLRFGEYVNKESEKKSIEQLAWELLPIGKGYEWNQALMDYAALILKNEKVPVPKQSAFLGSRRSYRGKVIKLLITHRELSFSQLWSLVQDSQSKNEEWFQELLEELIKEGLIKQEKDLYFL